MYANAPAGLLSGVLISAALACIPAYIARLKGDSFGMFFLLSLMFFPGALLGALLMKPNH